MSDNDLEGTPSWYTPGRTMKPKKMKAANDTSDACYTPGYAVDPLMPFIRWFGKGGRRVWEPASGTGYLARALERRAVKTFSSTIQAGQDFFTFTPDLSYIDALIMNPPYSLKFPWLERCYEIGKPFAMLVPVEMIGAGACQKLTNKYGVELMFLSRRINFCMPNAGWARSSAQFPVMWLCHGILPLPIMYGDVVYPKTCDVWV